MTKLPEKDLFQDLSQIIEQGKKLLSKQVNSTITLVYWQVGYKINTYILDKQRAAYAQEVVSTLSSQLKELYVKSFAERNLRRMMQFANVFPDFLKLSPLATHLSWSHFVELLPIKND